MCIFSVAREFTARACSSGKIIQLNFPLKREKTCAGPVEYFLFPKKAIFREILHNFQSCSEYGNIAPWQAAWEFPKKQRFWHGLEPAIFVFYSRKYELFVYG